MEQIAPSSESTEIAILGACLLDVTAINDALEHLIAADFYLDSHQKIYTVIMDLIETGNTVGFIEVQDELERRKEIEAIGGPAYLAYLTEGIPRNLNIESYVRIVKDKSTLRRLMSLGNTFVARAADDSESSKDILADVEEQILELTYAQESRGFRTMLDALKDANGLDAYIEKMCDPLAVTGLPMGFKDIDDMTGGMKPGDLIIIAGRPGSGKSSFAINVAVNVTLKDKDAVIAVFSLEMTESALYRRMLCSVASVSSRRMQTGFIGQQERSQISGAAQWLAERKIHIDDTASLTTVQMRARARRLKQRLGRLDLIVIDYVQLLTPSKKYGNREQEVASLSRGTKALAKELAVPVIALAQLSRAGETQGNKRPMLSSLRESGQLEQDADHVGFIHREELFDPTNEEVKGLAEYLIAKQREGPTGVVRLAYISDLTKFADLHIQR